jgi:DNA polymerase V
MGDIALCSEKAEEYLYKMFGVNAELLIDHAWGWEPCEIADIRSYRPKSNSFSSGQVLKEPYPYDKALVVAMEMADDIGLHLLRHGLLTNQVVLTIGYDVSNVKNGYNGEVKPDFYGRLVPKHAHGTHNLSEYSCLSQEIRAAVKDLFERLVDPELLIRRIAIDVNHIKTEKDVSKESKQLGLFDVTKDKTKEKRANEAVLAIKKRYGKNAILTGINFEEGATGRERNAQIGGHRK